MIRAKMIMTARLLRVMLDDDDDDDKDADDGDDDESIKMTTRPVSYTHLTLPTILLV